jgi:hypothetical protein
VNFDYQIRLTRISKNDDGEVAGTFTAASMTSDRELADMRLDGKSVVQILVGNLCDKFVNEWGDKFVRGPGLVTGRRAR